MKEIRVLSDNMINLVSAGEVIERPASVVKELVENSIDAGANNIKIEIRNGGKKLIHVSDNGEGISKNNIRLAFISHATSKIFQESDLEKILTLGFRGEALASICTISKLDIMTSQCGALLGYHYRIEGGNEVFLKECSPINGSSIMVRDLFYNTPARMKFLKKDITEGNYISSMVDKIILSHPEVSFKFVRDGKDVISSLGDGKLESAILRVFGRNFFDNLIEIDYKSNNILIKGYISNPDLSKSSKIQNFFINGRWIKDKIISNAIEVALDSEYKQNRVSCIVNIDIPTEIVDVNVHPSKSEVRFSNEKLVFDSVFNAVKNSLIIYKKKIFDFSDSNIIKNESISKESQDILHDNVIIPKLNQNIIPKKSSNNQLNLSKSKVQFFAKTDGFKQKISSNTYCKDQNENNFGEKTRRLGDKIYKNIVDKIEFVRNKVEVIGEIFGCFIIFQLNNDIILVDKHAAHERIIFEKLTNIKEKVCSQTLISSIVINFSQSDYENLLENLKELNNIGYGIEDFGPNKLVVREIPMYLNDKDTKESLCEFAEFFSKNRSKDLNLLKKVYASIACKSAIKSGKNSDEYEIKSLLNNLIESGLSNCPHGRPIYISINKDEIYKKFLRK